MTSKSDQRKKILVHIDARYAVSREMISGILRFAATRAFWDIQTCGAHPSSEPLENFQSWKPDALIADASVNFLTDEAFDAISGKCIVFVNTPPRPGCRKRHVRLRSDDREIALAAVRLFIGRKLTNFAFIGSPASEDWSDVRKRFFQDALQRKGYRPAVFETDGSVPWRTQMDTMVAWLRTLPKPCGILAAYDQRAKHVLDACRLARIAVPEQVQVLGIDNEPLVCEHTLPSLSSIAPDFESGGYLAAECIDRMLSGDRNLQHHKDLTFPLGGIVERLSTADVNGRARHVAVAKEFIRKHATSGIGLREVAAAAGISVRLLQKDYPSVSGHTVIDDLIDARIRRAKELLVKTNTPLAQIAPLAGFRSPNHMMSLFKRKTGQTMGDYRNR